MEKPYPARLEFDLRDGYVQVYSDGDKSLDYSRRFLEKLVEFCRKHDCYKILGISHSQTPFTQVEALEIPNLWDEFGIRPPFKIAWVENDKRAYDNYDLAEVVLRLRQYPCRLFDNVEHAKHWLLQTEVH